MRFKSTTLAFVILSFASGVALAASADDTKWINQCIADNKGTPNVSEAVIRKYCTCMTNKMSENETQSVTQWEKTHATERAACDKEAGWR